ncbi:MAG: hypothetical protein KGM17_13330 [Sphingomonadales bacterium]|nr:hypothetical protein [Sphingomonadales bacterium]
MAQWGQVGVVGLGHEPEAGVHSYLAQVGEGSRRDGAWARLRHLARVNIAHNYIHGVRRRSNALDWLDRAGRIEQRLLQPLHRPGPLTERAQKFRDLDYAVGQGMVPVSLVAALRDEIFAAGHYHDPYQPDFAHHGPPELSDHPLLYMEARALHGSASFLRICANPGFIAFCHEVLGPAAALTWAWAWISNPAASNYQNQNWHRDSAEPLNFIRCFVPLNPIAGIEDGPTALIPGSSRAPECREVRRFSDDDIAPLQARYGAGIVGAEPGDMYFVNTMAVHKGVTPQRRRALLSLLVSLGPSHRTPSIVPVRFADQPEDVKDVVGAHRRFFRHLVA